MVACHCLCSMQSWEWINTILLEPTQLKPPPASPIPAWHPVDTMDSSPAEPGALFQCRNRQVATYRENKFKFKLPTWQYRDLPLSH